MRHYTSSAAIVTDRERDAVTEVIESLARHARVFKRIACESRLQLQPVGTLNSYGEATVRVDARLDSRVMSVLRQHPSIIGHAFSEETGRSAIGTGFLTAIVDPLDGTKNYQMGLSYYATSVALINPSGELIGAFVANLATGTYFTAVRGMGAYRNAFAMIKSPGSDATKLDRMDMIFVGLVKDQLSLGALMRLAGRSTSWRAMGCAALDLCCLAAGRCDVFVDLSGTARLVDVMAASLIAEEAGRVVTDDCGVRITTQLMGVADITGPVQMHRFIVIGGGTATCHTMVLEVLDCQVRN